MRKRIYATPPNLLDIREMLFDTNTNIGKGKYRPSPKQYDRLINHTIKLAKQVNLKLLLEYLNLNNNRKILTNQIIIQRDKKTNKIKHIKL